MNNFTIDSTITLNNGVEMPRLGLGVWKSNLRDTKFSVQTAIEEGYLMIDTAKQYGNESAVGEGIKAGLQSTGKKREDLFITTKVFNGDQGYESTLENFQGSLDRLQLDYLDLYLVHWPVTGKYKDTWRALEKLYNEKKIRAIGVSNFDVSTMKELLKDAEVVPAVNQVECHPLLQQNDLRAYAKEIGMHIEAWSPLGGGQLLQNDTLNEIGQKYGKSSAQVILRWDLQSDIITIPKSVHKERIIQNADLFDFELTEEDMDTIAQINEGKRTGPWLDAFDWHNPETGSKDEVVELDE